MGNYVSYEQNIQNNQTFSGPPLKNSTDFPDNPQQNLFTFDELSFDSRFEGGNLMFADKVGPGEYNLWIAPDCYKTTFETKQRVSFYFKVINVNLQGFPSRNITLRIMNMNSLEHKNYREGMVPVYLSTSNNNIWQYLPSPLTEINKVNNKTIEISFQYNFNLVDSQKGVYFAFTFPYTYSDCQTFVDYLERTYALHPSIYFHRELLTYSPEGRRLDVITITNHDNYSLNPTPPYILEPMLTDLFPTHPPQLKEPPLLTNRNVHRPYVFRNKGYILLSARIHAAESPANFLLQGFLLGLLKQNDPVSQALLQNFVFVIVPMLNPDGVWRGHYRTDLKGRDMNRAYDKALTMPGEYPGPHALMQLAKSLSTNKRLVMYIDFHAHSNIDSGFIIAPHHQDPQTMSEMRLFSRMMDIYSQSFDFNSCDFGNPQDLQNPDVQGIAKNAIRNLTGIVHSYTFESGYHRTTKDPFRYSPQHNVEQILTKSVPKRIGVSEFFEMGDCVRHAMLETLLRYHPMSALNKTWYGNINSLHTKIYQNLMQKQEIMDRMKEVQGSNDYQGDGESDI